MQALLTLKKLVRSVWLLKVYPCPGENLSLCECLENPLHTDGQMCGV